MEDYQQSISYWKKVIILMEESKRYSPTEMDRAYSHLVNYQIKAELLDEAEASLSNPHFAYSGFSQRTKNNHLILHARLAYAKDKAILNPPQECLSALECASFQPIPGWFYHH